MSTPVIERRYFRTIELRSVGQTMSIEGVAVSYNSLSPKGNLPGFREKIAPGAFTRSLNGGRSVSALINHDPNLVLGKTSARNLQLADGATALRFRCDCTSTSYAKDLIENIRAGVISQCSFGFQCEDDDWDADPDDRNSLIRTVRQAKLFDVSCVTSPVYDDTNVDEAAARAFPMGIPGELRSRLNRWGIIVPNLPVSESERRRMEMRLKLALSE